MDKINKIVGKLKFWRKRINTERINGIITALEPIHHGGSEDYGTTKLILSLPTIIKNPVTGEEEIDNIPCIHGNAIRGMLRRLLLDDFLTLLDYELDSKKVYHFLFTGGLLEALDPKDKGAINLDTKKKIKTYLPPISLLGSALGNQMIHGKLKVGFANLVCKETQQYTSETAKHSAYELKSIDYGTRLDDLKEEKTEKDEQAHQMKYEFETIIRGAKFTHEFILEDCNSVERACFCRMFKLWEENPTIGGKSGTGYGKVKLDYQIDNKDDSDYIKYIKDNKDDICEFLDGLVKIWK